MIGKATFEQTPHGVLMYVEVAGLPPGAHGIHLHAVGAWWETLDCRKMRVAAGDGNTADPTSPYCTHYPGSDFSPEKILSAEALAHVNKVGQALLGRDDPGTYPPTS